MLDAMGEVFGFWGAMDFCVGSGELWERGYLCRLEAGATLWELGPFGT